jgi:hypothetical protein
MAKKRRAEAEERPALTLQRFTRFYRLLQLLGEGPQTRAVLLRRLRVGVRDFYRDLEALRGLGIVLSVVAGSYRLDEAAAAAQDRLPFPDPHLTLGEVRRLVKGRSPAHQRLKEQLDRLAP